MNKAIFLIIIGDIDFIFLRHLFVIEAPPPLFIVIILVVFLATYIIIHTM